MGGVLQGFGFPEFGVNSVCYYAFYIMEFNL